MAVSRSARVIALAAGMCVFLVPGAVASRKPTPTESRAIRAIAATYGHTRLQMRVSTRNSAFANVRYRPDAITVRQGGFTPEVGDLLMRRGANGWPRIYEAIVSGYTDIGVLKNHRSAGVCAYAPTAVVQDLYGITCPAWRALHARRATTAERASFRVAVQSSPLTRKYGRDQFQLVQGCVSRLKPEWGAAIGLFPNASGPIWFRRVDRWEVYTDSLALARGGNPPTPAVVLSLASCTEYSPSMYGA